MTNPELVQTLNDLSTEAWSLVPSLQLSHRSGRLYAHAVAVAELAGAVAEHGRFERQQDELRQIERDAEPASGGAVVEPIIDGAGCTAYRAICDVCSWHGDASHQRHKAAADAEDHNDDHAFALEAERLAALDEVAQQRATPQPAYRGYETADAWAEAEMQS